jgi:hypothetical protein
VLRRKGAFGEVSVMLCELTMSVAEAELYTLDGDDFANCAAVRRRNVAVEGIAYDSITRERSSQLQSTKQ